MYAVMNRLFIVFAQILNYFLKINRLGWNCSGKGMHIFKALENQNALQKGYTSFIHTNSILECSFPPHPPHGNYNFYKSLPINTQLAVSHCMNPSPPFFFASEVSFSWKTGTYIPASGRHLYSDFHAGTFAILLLHKSSLYIKEVLVLPRIWCK